MIRTPKTTGCCPPKTEQSAKASSCCPPREETALEPCSPPKSETTSCCSPQPTVKKSCCPPQEAPTQEPCCPPPAGETTSGCCSPSPEATRRGWEKPGFRLWKFVTGWLDTPVGTVPQVDSSLQRGDTLGHWAMRWGIGRDRYRIAPGLYAVGTPDAESPVIVTANYKMTFDLVRRDLAGRAAWILVLETFGINVWCAAGKGTFGTDELVRCIEAAGLQQVVSHRRLILPQLGAVGVAAHAVARRCGFRVIYGPVRSADLPFFLDRNFEATPGMRRVTFTLRERLVLTPVELTAFGKHFLWAVLALLLVGGVGPGLFAFSAMVQRGGAAIIALVAATLAGAVLTPVLLPWLPTRTFAVKGAVTGGAFALAGLLVWRGELGIANSLALLLAVPAVSSWLAMNFTGSTTFTSPTGVEKEMRRTIPFQAGALLLAGICWVAAAF